MNHRKLRGLAVGATLAFGATAAFAQVTSPQTATLNVSATVASVCQLSAPSDISFGSVQAGVTANAAGSVTIACNKGATVSASVTSANALLTQKRMQLGPDYLDYQVWQPDLAAPATCAASQTDWTGSLGMSSLWAANGGPRIIAICATTTPSNALPAGLYTDVLTVSVSFS